MLVDDVELGELDILVVVVYTEVVVVVVVGVGLKYGAHHKKTNIK